MGGTTFPVRDLAPISKRHGTEGILSVLARNVGSPRRCNLSGSEVDRTSRTSRKQRSNCEELTTSKCLPLFVAGLKLQRGLDAISNL